MTRDSHNASFYDADSATYDETRWGTRAGALTNKSQQEIVLELCAGWSQGRTLEVGAGTGRFSVPLAEKGNRLTLVDISPEMLARTRANIDRRGLGRQVDAYVEGSVYALPFDDAEFDHAISLNVFNHLEHAADALEELARVIKPGSTLLFNYANLHSYYYPAGRRINARGRAVGQDVFSIWETGARVGEFVDGAGLRVIRQAGHVHVPRWMERYRLHHLVAILDRISRWGPLSRFAPVQFCLCEKRRE